MQIGSNHFTVQKAMRELAREGLVVRQRKSGTFVAGVSPGLHCLGLYHAMAFPPPRHDAYVYRLHLEIQKLVEARGIGLRVWNDERSEQSSPPQSLLQAAERREIQGLVSTVVHAERRPWLRKLPIAVTMQGPGMDGVSSASFDTFSFFEQGLKALRRQGMNSCGIIVPFRADTFRPVLERCQILATKLKLELRKECVVCLPDAIDEIYSSEYEACGYEAYQRFHRIRNRPEGLMVYPDSICRGVVLSMIDKKVRVPEKLRVVMHTNDEIGMFCPFPFIGITSCIQTLAEVLIRQIDDLIAGKSACRQKVAHSVSHASGFPQMRGGRFFDSKVSSPRGVLPKKER